MSRRERALTALKWAVGEVEQQLREDAALRSEIAGAAERLGWSLTAPNRTSVYVDAWATAVTDDTVSVVMQAVTGFMLRAEHIHHVVLPLAEPVDKERFERAEIGLPTASIHVPEWERLANDRVGRRDAGPAVIAALLAAGDRWGVVTADPDMVQQTFERTSNYSTVKDLRTGAVVEDIYFDVELWLAASTGHELEQTHEVMEILSRGGRRALLRYQQDEDRHWTTCYVVLQNQ